ncbi:MAG: hypothetical protein NTW86_23665, partial [Candidatus Sumerlaeota bacterium]|nr:hypothetical protein [Candidatus Sumerlaeota bacterium]
SRSGFVVGLSQGGAVDWVEYLDGPAVALSAAPVAWLAATQAGSLYALNPGKQIRERLALGRPVRFIRAFPTAGGSTRLYLAGDTTVQIADRAGQ